jgi:hypothetical protein
MPDFRSMPRVGAMLVAALALLPLTVTEVTAGQRQSTLSVTVEVVDTCHAATGRSGLAMHECASDATPLAVLREPGRDSATASRAAAPLLRLAEPDGYITVVY